MAYNPSKFGLFLWLPFISGERHKMFSKILAAGLLATPGINFHHSICSVIYTTYKLTVPNELDSCTTCSSLFKLFLVYCVLDQVSTLLMKMTANSPSALVRAKSTRALSLILNDMEVSSSWSVFTNDNFIVTSSLHISYDPWLLTHRES